MASARYCQPRYQKRSDSSQEPHQHRSGEKGLRAFLPVDDEAGHNQKAQDPYQTERQSIGSRPALHDKAVTGQSEQTESGDKLKELLGVPAQLTAPTLTDSLNFLSMMLMTCRHMAPS